MSVYQETNQQIESFKKKLELAKIKNKWWRVREPTDASTVTTPQLQRTSQKRSRKMVKGEILPYIDDKNDMD